MAEPGDPRVEVVRKHLQAVGDLEGRVNLTLAGLTMLAAEVGTDIQIRQGADLEVTALPLGSALNGYRRAAEALLVSLEHRVALLASETPPGAPPAADRLAAAYPDLPDFMLAALVRALWELRRYLPELEQVRTTMARCMAAAQVVRDATGRDTALRRAEGHWWTVEQQVGLLLGALRELGDVEEAGPGGTGRDELKGA